MQDLVFIVRPPGRPADTRAFTLDELDEAQAYATQTGGQVDRLT
ncbi:hypothetical protein [Gordonia paraffinivorans]|nr:hypothetical protein [Gordonia paraffinivorans]